MASPRHFHRIGLTNPLTRGREVRVAQELLKHNRFGVFYGGKVDGIFGDHTAHAAHSAKYWLGYPRKHLDGSVAQHLHDYLLDRKHPHHRRLPKAYHARRVWRQLKRRHWRMKHNLARRALGHSISEIGAKESPPGSNHCFVTEWYGMVGPWCIMFVTWAYVKAGSKVFVRGSRWASVAQFFDDVQSGRLAAHFTHDPKPGTVVCYDFDEPFQHAELFKEWVDPGVSFMAVGGNTSGTNPADGGMVADSLRWISQVQFMVEVHA